MNPNQMYMCPYGHLQYNLAQEEVEELESRGMVAPDVVFRGAKCRRCDERVFELTSNPKELQMKLGAALEGLTSLQLQLPPLLAVNKDYNELSLWMRNNYVWEQYQQQPQHKGMLSEAAIHYLRIERGRSSVQLAKIWRAFLRFIGAS